MKVLIISSSPREGGNSDQLADNLAKGALKAGHQVRKILSNRLRIRGCQECYYCHKSGGICAIKDDMQGIYAAIRDSEVVVFSTPIFYYSVSAQLKLIWDRTYCDHELFSGKTVHLLSACAAPDPAYTATLRDCFERYCSCLKGARIGQVIIALSTTQKGSVRDNPALQEAYELGKGL